MTDDMILPNWESTGNNIKVIGVGGGGTNAVSHMYNNGIKNVDFLICNTDLQALKRSPVPDKLQLGAVLTKGLGTGCDPDKGRKAAEESIEQIKASLGGSTELVFITAGMGGGTGTGAAPIIAEVAQELGLLTIAVVTLPFRDERSEFMRRAIAGIKELEKHVDSLLIIDNQKMYRLFDDLTIFDAFPKVDEVLSTAVRGISDIITSDGYINVDLNDVRMAMKNSGMALMGIGVAEGENRAIKAVEQALKSPLLSDYDLSSAKSVLVNITTSRQGALKVDEINQALDYINDYTRSAYNFKRGFVEDESMGERVSITIVVTGFNMSALPQIQDNTFNPEDTITLDDGNEASRQSGFGGIDLGLDEDETPFTSFSSRNSFFERYKNKPEIPDLIVEIGENLTALERTPAYKRRGITIDSLNPNNNPE